MSQRQNQSNLKSKKNKSLNNKKISQDTEANDKTMQKDDKENNLNVNDNDLLSATIPIQSSNNDDKSNLTLQKSEQETKSKKYDALSIFSGTHYFGDPLVQNQINSNNLSNQNKGENIPHTVNYFTRQNINQNPQNIQIKNECSDMIPNEDKDNEQFECIVNKISSSMVGNLQSDQSSKISTNKGLSFNSEFFENIEKPKLQNIVSTANLKCALELKEIALRAKNAEYNPRRFAAVIMRIREPKTTALIFASGKMVCTGARSEEDSKKAARLYAKIILKLGFPVKFSEFKVQNIVASCDVKFPIRLEMLASKYLQSSCYEPEMFPGLIFHMIEPKVVLLIFVSGKIVLTGAKDRNDIYNAFKNIYSVLLLFKKTDYIGSANNVSVNKNTTEIKNEDIKEKE